MVQKEPGLKNVEGTYRQHQCLVIPLNDFVSLVKELTGEDLFYDGKRLIVSSDASVLTSAPSKKSRSIHKVLEKHFNIQIVSMHTSAYSFERAFAAVWIAYKNEA